MSVLMMQRNEVQHTRVWLLKIPLHHSPPGLLVAFTATMPSRVGVYTPLLRTCCSSGA